MCCFSIPTVMVLLVLDLYRHARMSGYCVHWCGTQYSFCGWPQKETILSQSIWGHNGLKSSIYFNPVIRHIIFDLWINRLFRISDTRLCFLINLPQYRYIVWNDYIEFACNLGLIFKLYVKISLSYYIMPRMCSRFEIFSYVLYVSLSGVGFLQY